MAEPEPRKLPAPEPNPETQPFWDAAVRGVLMVKRCTACTRPHHYPRALCPHCQSPDTLWEETNGEGVLYSFSVMRRGPGAPFVLAYVALDAGPAMLTNIVDADPDALRIGQRMRVRFVPTDGPPVPMFAPVTG
jgi:uncharacterized OB-fold protein